LNNWNNSEQFRAIEQFEAIWRKFEQFGAIWSNLKQSKQLGGAYILPRACAKLPARLASTDPEF
jgi:hypothetical protein